MQHGQRAQLFTEVVHQRADIGALADNAPQRAFLGVLVEVQQGHFVYDDVTGGPLHLPALAGEVIQLLAVHLYR